MMLRRLMSNALARLRERLHHQLERRREQERVADLVLLDQRERALGVEAAAIADDRLAEIQRGQQRVHQAAGPRPVGRRPEQVARLREAVVRVDEARQVAEQALLRHQRALRRAGRAARVDQQRGVGRARGHAREMPATPLAAIVPAVDAGPASRRRRRRRAADAGQRSRIGARLGSDCGSTNATFAALFCSRYSSASGPNRNDSGTATAPI